jgi:cytochrome oxidase Cu insertion factor (SCO1/SenC/PrrC family)
MAASEKSPNSFQRQWKVLLALSVAVVLLVIAAMVVVFVGRGKRPAAAHVSSLKTPSVARMNPDVDVGSPASGAVAPDFELHDQKGRLTSLRQFRGKVVVLAMIDSHCTTICPMTTESMVEALRLLGPAAAQVQLIGINANPLALRVADVADYTRAHDMQGKWRFLTGSLAQLKSVWQGYHVYVAAIHNDIDHDPAIFLIGPHGHERREYLTQLSYEGVDQQAQILAQGIARLLPGHPAIRRETSLQYVQPLGPKDTAQLAAFGSPGRKVVIGGDHPHLLLFFAEWLDENANLRTKLAALDGYAKAARRNHWPAPVAIDELSTEASPAEARKLLAGFASNLSAPIVEDATGRLADGYHVKDLPWFVLSSPSGRILWHHDGWLSSSALDRDVRAALSSGT